MSDDIDVSHGGAIAVDPDQLRAVANALVALAPKFADAAAAIRRAQGCLVGLQSASRRVDTVALGGSAERAEALHEQCLSAGESTQLMADVYELVERRIELDGLAIQGMSPSDTLLDRIDELEESDPRVLEMEKWVIAGWEQSEVRQSPVDWTDHVTSPLIGLPFLIANVLTFASLVGSTGLGQLPPGTRLSGSGGPVSLTPVPRIEPVGPPNTVAEALRRFPEAPGAQIKVEKYTMPDGTKQFVLYEKGTQLTLDEDEPFDPVTSNEDLYVEREESASYVATVEALKAAGAKPGDEVQIYAFSQGAMNASYLAMQSVFDVSVVVTAGSPTVSALRDDQLSIQLGDIRDPVYRLGGGGIPGGIGAPDSIVVTKESDGFPGIVHSLDHYIEMADQLAGAEDVRMEAWRDKAKELKTAVSIESTEYVAKRE